MPTYRDLPKQVKEETYMNLMSIISENEKLIKIYENNIKAHKQCNKEIKKFLKNRRSTEQLEKLLTWHKQFVER